MKAEKTENGFRIFDSESRNRYLLVLYISVAVSFLFLVTLHRRGYQDAWILDDILAPTIVFIFFALIVETFVSDNRITAAVGASFSAVLNLIPSLKYHLLYGCYDSVAHYGYVKELISLGFVPKTGFYAQYYSDTPGMHIFLGSLSIVSGIPVNEVTKFTLPVIYGTIPLLVFFITNGLFDKTVQRYIIIASSFPLVILGHFLTGTTFALILYLLFIAFFLRGAIRNRDKVENGIVLVIIAFSLIVSHGVTSLFLSFLLILMVLALKFLKFTGISIPRRSLINHYIVTSSFFTILLITWWTFKANFFLNSLADIVHRILFQEIRAKPIPARFFEIPLSAKLKILALFHLSDVIIGIISLLGLFVLIRKFKQKELFHKIKEFYLNLVLFFGIIATIMFIQVVFGFGEIEYDRFIHYAIVLSPFLVGLALWHLDRFLISAFRKIRIKNLAFAIILFVIVASCLIQIFPYQPLVPRASILSKDLPEDEYLIDFRSVNTIYQKEMISFAERYTSLNLKELKITSDIVTRQQIFGFTNSSFSSTHIWYSIFSPNMTLEWNLCLLHMGDKAGPFNEKPEYRTDEAINRLLSEGNLVYDNGESFILEK